MATFSFSKPQMGVPSTNMTPSMSVPMGGFAGQNQIGGQSQALIFKKPEPQDFQVFQTPQGAKKFLESKGLSSGYEQLYEQLDDASMSSKKPLSMIEMNKLSSQGLLEDVLFGGLDPFELQEQQKQFNLDTFQKARPGLLFGSSKSSSNGAAKQANIDNLLAFGNKFSSQNY